jgi:hypothetical protein
MTHNRPVVSLPGIWRFADVFEQIRSLAWQDVVFYRHAALQWPELAPGERVRVVALPTREAGYPYAGELIRSYTASGWTLYTLCRGGSPVAYAWTKSSSCHVVTEVRAVVGLQSASLWIVNCVTPEVYRGGGNYPRLIGEIVRLHPGAAAYIYCLASNSASRRGIEKAGFRLEGVLCRRFGRLKCTVPGVTAKPLQGRL